MSAQHAQIMDQPHHMQLDCKFQRSQHNIILLNIPIQTLAFTFRQVGTFIQSLIVVSHVVLAKQMPKMHACMLSGATTVWKSNYLLLDVQ